MSSYNRYQRICFMKHWRIGVFLYLLLVIWLIHGCSLKQPTAQVDKGISNAASDQLLPTSTQEIWPTPVLTATPIVQKPETEEGIEDLLDNLYSVDPEYRLDILNVQELSIEKPCLEFKRSNMDPNSKDIWISEIADNSSASLRAFIACDRNLCQQKLYVENTQDQTILEVDWSGRIPYRPISHIMWIGENQLAFSHLTGPHNAIVAIVRVNDEDFLYYWLVSYP